MKKDSIISVVTKYVFSKCIVIRAIKSYTKFKDEAAESRLKEFFSALVEIEIDHLNLHAEKLRQLKSEIMQ